MAIYSEEADSWNPTIGNKLYERETILCRRMEEGKTEYEAIVLQTNALQSDILGSQLPQVMNYIVLKDDLHLYYYLGCVYSRVCGRVVLFMIGWVAMVFGRGGAIFRGHLRNLSQ